MGDDTDSSTSYDALLKALTPPERTRHPVRLFTILYSPRGRDKEHTGAAQEGLAALAAATGGKSFVAGERKITDIIRDILSSY